MSPRAPAIHFACPGAIDQPTGGYRYDAAIVRELRAAGREVVVHELTGSHPLADDDARVCCVVADAARLPFRDTSFAMIVQTRFLDRAIVPDLLRLLVRGGLLVVETFLVAQHEATGHPRREFCLEPGELEALCRGADVEVVEQREGLTREGHDAVHLAAIAVCKV